MRVLRRLKERYKQLCIISLERSIKSKKVVFSYESALESDFKITCLTSLRF